MSECKEYVLSNTNGLVELWMKQRLSNGPLHCWMKKALKSLQIELQTLEANTGQIIEGKYVSSECGGHPSDAENVLFYNVRNTNFIKSSQHGLRFRCLFETLPKPQESSEYFAHYQSYRLVQKDAPFLGEYENVASYEFHSSKPELEDVWWGSVKAEWNLTPKWKWKLKKQEDLKKFALRVDARYPQSSTGEYTESRVKKVFDGITSAMHFWENPDEELVSRIVNLKFKCLKVSSKSVREKLQSKNHALLGERELLVKKNGISWNPADDMKRFVAGELRFSENNQKCWLFKVRILSVESFLGSGR